MIYAAEESDSTSNQEQFFTFYIFSYCQIVTLSNEICNSEHFFTCDSTFSSEICRRGGGPQNSASSSEHVLHPFINSVHNFQYGLKLSIQILNTEKNKFCKRLIDTCHMIPISSITQKTDQKSGVKVFTSLVFMDNGHTHICNFQTLICPSWSYICTY